MLIPFARQSRPGAHAGERLINYFFQPEGDTGKGVLLGRTGLIESVSVSPFDPIYAVEEMGGSLYAITKTTVWKISGTTATSVGTINGTSDIRTAASFNQLAIVTNGLYYICDGSTTTAYSTGAITSPTDVAFLRGFFALTGTNSGRTDALQLSAADDGTTFDALDFVYAESNPDGLVGILAIRNELHLIGANTIEPYYLSGAASFAFSPNTGAVMERGCLDGKTVAADDNSYFWLGNDKIVYRNGAVPTVVGSLEMTADIKSRDVDRAFTFTDRGHKFYALRMVSGATWTMNLATGAWQEVSSGESHDAWIALNARMFNGTLYFGTTNGNICTQSGYNDDGQVVRAEMISPPVENGGEYIFLTKVHANFVTGRDDVATTPYVALEVTRDGVNWTDEKWKPLADLGGYMKRATWGGLGSARWFQGKFWITDEVLRDMIGGKIA